MTAVRQVNIAKRSPGNWQGLELVHDGRNQKVTADEELVVEMAIDLGVMRIVEKEGSRDRHASLRPFVHGIVVNLQHPVAKLDVLTAVRRHRLAISIRLLKRLCVSIVVVSIPGQERAKVHPSR